MVHGALGKGRDCSQGQVEETRVYKSLPFILVLFRIAKGDKMDYVVQKAVELGAAEIVPFTSVYSGQAGCQTRRTGRSAGSALPEVTRKWATRLPQVGRYILAELVARVETVSEDHADTSLIKCWNALTQNSCCPCDTLHEDLF